jgi:cell division protein FtsA
LARVESNNIVNILDIGASKIVCLTVLVDFLHAPKILGVGHQLSQGIGIGGVITDIKNLEKSIVSAVSQAEKSSGRNIEEVLINFSGSKLKSLYAEIELDISGGEVVDKDLSRINEMAFQNYSDENNDIIQSVPVSYEIDGIVGIINPAFMYGKKLKAYLNLVVQSPTVSHNFFNCLSRCHLNVSGVIPSAYASALAVLSHDEMQNGVIMLDIGESNCDVAIFVDGKMCYTLCLPFGGSLITRDIQQIFSLSKAVAERVKVLYGSIFFESDNKRDTIDLFDIVDVEDDGAGNYIQKHKLCEIIYARVREIFVYLENVFQHDKNAKKFYNKAKNNIVLTGGTSNLLGISELAKNVFGARVRVVKPKSIHNMPLEHQQPQFSTAYGLIAHAVSHNKLNSSEFRQFDNGSCFVNNIKRVFGYDAASDFLRKYF